MSLFFFGGAALQTAITPANSAPSVTAEDSLDGRTLTVTITNFSGNPAPTFSITMTADGDAVSATGGAAGPWSYTVPSSSSDVDLAWQVTATNSEGSANDNGTETVTADRQPAAFSRQFSEDIGDVVIDLSAIGPVESGTATYTLQGTPTGASVAGSNLTIDTDTAADGTITVRRNDNNGDTDLVLTLDMVTRALVITGGTAAHTQGADDPTDTLYTYTPSSGAYNGVEINFSRFQLDNLADGRGHPALDPVIGFTTDSGSDGALASSDVAEVTLAGLWVYPAGATTPTITRVWRDTVGLLGDTDTSYTGDGSEVGSVTNVETDGASTAISNAIPVFAVSVNPEIASAAFTDNTAPSLDDLLIRGTYAGADALDVTLEYRESTTLHATATVSAITVTGGLFDFNETIEAADLTYEVGSSASDMANVDNIIVTISEQNNGGSDNVTVTGVSGLVVTATAAINSITYDTAGAVIDYTGTLAIAYDTAGADLEAT